MSTTILSPVVDKAAQTAMTYGNQIAEISEGWTKVLQVVHMSLPLSDDARASISADPELRHWVTEPTPHNKGEEGFTCDRDKVAISFPR